MFSAQSTNSVCGQVVGLPLAAPPCGAFSLARLKPGGPRPVRTPQFPDGLPGLLPDQLRELTVSRELHEFARELLSLVSMRGGVVLVENPASSLTWKTRGAEAWTRQFTPYLACLECCTASARYTLNFAKLATPPCLKLLSSQVSIWTPKATSVQVHIMPGQQEAGSRAIASITRAATLKLPAFVTDDDMLADLAQGPDSEIGSGVLCVPPAATPSQPLAQAGLLTAEPVAVSSRMPSPG